MTSLQEFSTFLLLLGLNEDSMALSSSPAGHTLRAIKYTLSQSYVLAAFPTEVWICRRQGLA